MEVSRRGVGTSPEELLISAVSSCYTATPFAVLHRAGLPVDSLAVAASGTVTGISGRAQFAGTLVSPTILGGDVTRRPDCEAAAHMPHDRCFIARALRHLPSKRQPRAGDRVQPPGGETQFTPRAPEGGI